MDLGDITVAKIVLGAVAGAFGIAILATGRTVSAFLVGLSLALLSAAVLREALL